jgi:hypothetical protein
MKNYWGEWEIAENLRIKIGFGFSLKEGFEIRDLGLKKFLLLAYGILL